MPVLSFQRSAKTSSTVVTGDIELRNHPGVQGVHQDAAGTAHSTTSLLFASHHRLGGPSHAVGQTLILIRPLLLSILFVLILGRAQATVTTRDVERLDAYRMQALVATDIDALRAIIHPLCVYTHASGKIQSGDEYLQLLAEGRLRYESISYVDQPVIRSHGETLVIIAGIVHLTANAREGPKHERRLAATATYMFLQEGWRLVSYQSTEIPRSKDARSP